jgi:hypothetical protein
VRKADNLPPSCADIKKSGGFKLMESCAPVQACNGRAFLLKGMQQYCFESSSFLPKLKVVLSSVITVHNFTLRRFSRVLCWFEFILVLSVE